MEEEENGEINFLDCKLSKKTFGDRTNILFSVFRKLTFTGLGMNFHSHTFFNFKMNNIKTMLYRAFSISSNWTGFTGEVEFLTDFFTNNGYPRNLVYNATRKFLNNKLNSVRLTTVNKMPFYHKFPFINNYSCNHIKTNYVTFLQRFYPQIDFKFIFSNNFTIRSCTKHKESLPRNLESGIVYLYTCGDCNATYIGSSIKALRTRICEHFSVSSRTGNPLARPLPSSIRDHIEQCKCLRSFDQFKILSRHNDINMLRMSETYEILERKPNLNMDNTSHPIVLV